MVGLRVQGPARDLRPQAHRRALVARLLRRGDQAKCRAALQASLADAIDHADRKALYGRGDCASTPDPACFDQNRPTVASAVDMPPFPFQNRPTFQQTVSVGG